jgi:hypothetical protein
MARYETREKGVYDRDTDRIVLRRDSAWSEYLDWMRAGNTPDPMPTVILPPLPPEEVAARAELAARAVMRNDLRVDATIQFLRTHTPAEAEAWVQANVTDLATAKTVLSKLAMIVAYLARERLAQS